MREFQCKNEKEDLTVNLENKYREVPFDILLLCKTNSKAQAGYQMKLYFLYFRRCQLKYCNIS